MSALPVDTMSETEYLAMERASEIKHEYVDGYTYAMAAASRSHNLICTNVVAILHPNLRKKPCEIYQSDMRLKVQVSGLYTYPDISVACGEPQFADDTFDTLLNPVLLVEVLSASTNAYDRGKKFQHYRQIESLREYLLIAQDSPRIERFVRQDDDTWVLTDAVGLEASIALASVAATLPLVEVYERVTFEAEASEEPA
jgi:Uma2 family endonuclease